MDARTPYSELAALIAASPNPVLLVSSDLTIAAASDPYLAMMGASQEELIGQNVRDAFAGSDSLEALVASLNAAVRTRQPHRMTPGLYQAGAAVPRHQRLLEVVNSPLIVSDDEPRWIIHRASEPKPPAAADASSPSMEMALHAAEARLRSILRTVPDAMIIIDGRGRIESLSSTAERLFGYALDEVAGENISKFMPNPHREQHD